MVCLFGNHNSKKKEKKVFMDVPNQDIRGVSFDIFVYFFNYKLMCVSYKQTLYSLRSCIKTNLLLLLLLLVRVCAHQGKQGPWEHLRMCPTILKNLPTNFEGWIHLYGPFVPCHGFLCQFYQVPLHIPKHILHSKSNLNLESRRIRIFNLT